MGVFGNTFGTQGVFLNQSPGVYGEIFITSIQGAVLDPVRIEIGMVQGANLVVDYGDGTIETVTYQSNLTKSQHTHSYTTNNTTYTIKIKGDMNKLLKFLINDYTSEGITNKTLHINITEFNKCTNLDSFYQSGDFLFITGNVAGLSATKITELSLVAPENTCSGDVSGLIYLQRLIITGNNSMYGNVQNLPLTWLRHAGNITNGGFSGSVTNMTNLTILRTSDNCSLSGSVTNLVKLNRLWLSGSTCTITGSVDNLVLLTEISSSGGNTVTGSITNLTLLNWIYSVSNPWSGSISNLTNLNSINVLGANTLTGSLTNLTLLTFLSLNGTNTVSGDITNCPLTYMNIGGSASFVGSVTGKVLTYVTLPDTVSLSGNISSSTNLTFLYSGSSTNTLTGDLSGLSKLTTLLVYGNNTLSGSIANNTNITRFECLGTNTISGSIAGLTKLTRIYVSGNNTLSGSIAALTLLTYIYLYGNNTVTGDISTLVNIAYFDIGGSNTASFSTVAPCTKLGYLYVHTTVVLTSTNINQILADFWLNKDTIKGSTSRQIRIEGGVGTGAPTGQGITDKAALQAYRSPNPPGTNSLWYILTR